MRAAIALHWSQISMKKFLLSTALLAIVGGLVVLGFLLFRDQQGPQISLTPAEGRISPRTVFKLTAKDTNSGVKALSVRVKKNSREFIALDQQWADKLVSRTEEFSLEKAEEMGEGTVELIVKATDSSFAAFGKGNTSTRSFTLRLDSQPPRISVTTLPPYVRRGGSACIAYTVNEDVRQTGVTVNDLYFPGYRQADGSYLCFFAFPFYEDTNTYAPRVTAEDEAGNVTSISLAVKPLHVAFREDTIRLPDSFLDNKMQDFTDEFPGQMSSLERFLKVNRDLRKANRAALLSIGRKTSPAMLWSGRFLNLPNASNRAGFADHRAYIYNGQQVDDQYHLGLDMASIARAPIPAANNGTVVFADDMGIYGLCVVVDHGLGLQTLYAHLSEIHVKDGDTVQRGDILGLTGTTGMAGGDHLHFGVILSGLPVQPLEWLDPRWIKHNITDRLER
jgi:murein DD-endopeptidase MepM/ murein hydrolase activator NlpD